MFVFNKKYFFIGGFLLFVEVLIALYLHDRIIRPYIGDLLVVIMIYCFLKAFYNGSVVVISLSVLIFAFIVEASQYFKLINYLGLQHSKIAGIILGSSFEWIDIAAYIIGIAIVLFAERLKTTYVKKRNLPEVGKEKQFL